MKIHVWPQGACHLKHKGFLEDEDASDGHTDLTLIQEDFGTITSVIQDDVEKTNPKLNLVLAEGGGEPGKNRVDDKQTKDNPLLLLQDIELIHRSEPL